MDKGIEVGVTQRSKIEYSKIVRRRNKMLHNPLLKRKQPWRLREKLQMVKTKLMEDNRGGKERGRGEKREGRLDIVRLGV